MGINKRLISFLLIVLLLIGGWAIYNFDTTIYKFPDVPKSVTFETTDLSSKSIRVESDFKNEEQVGVTGKTNYSNKELLVDSTFTSNLPLIIIDTGNQEPKQGVVWDGEKDYYVSTEVDPYAYGELFVVNNSGGQNCPDDNAKTYSKCKIKLRGNSSSNYDKKQYLIKLVDENGKSEKYNILGMGSDSEWILNVSFIDKSLLRNYLAYSVAGEVMSYAPDVRFCEVLWKSENGYKYEGVYLMMESVKVGKHRVNLSQYSENSSTTPALLRRDRYNVNGLMLENYATTNELTSGFLDVEYPDKEVITENGIQNITRQIDCFEEALYSDVWEEFVKYRDYIDMQSFVDYFILNEFFMNYDAGYNSTYMYMDYSGKICMGPVWDFDQAMDNNATISANLQTTAFHSAPWFDRMLKDPVFTACIIERYAELRKTILSDKSIETYVGETIEYIEDAVERDWARWGYYYTEGNYLKPDSDSGQDRNTVTYQEEVDKILSVLSIHGTWMDNNLDSLYQFKMITLDETTAYSQTNKIDYRSMLAVVFIAVFIISVKMVLKYESE